MSVRGYAEPVEAAVQQAATGDVLRCFCFSSVLLQGCHVGAVYLVQLLLLLLRRGVRYSFYICVNIRFI